MGISRFLYGGLLASLIDCHGSAALALHHKNGHEIGDGAEPPRFVTANMNVDFLKPPLSLSTIHHSSINKMMSNKHYHQLSNIFIKL